VDAVEVLGSDEDQPALAPEQLFRGDPACPNVADDDIRTLVGEIRGLGHGDPGRHAFDVVSHERFASRAISFGQGRAVRIRRTGIDGAA
jgi:hypothetical protein